MTKTNVTEELPSNVRAERFVLGVALMDPECIPQLLELLTPADFYLPAHRTAFDCIRSLYANGRAIDRFTVTEALQDRGKLEQVGGYEYLANLDSDLPDLTNAQEYARMVRDKSLLRQAILTCRDLEHRCMTAPDASAEILSEAEAAIAALATDGAKQSQWLSPADIIAAEPGILDPQPTNQGVPTPWTRLTAALCGLHAGDLFVVAGRTSMGKTAAALQIAVMAALARVPVAVCSLEMDAASLMKRILAVISGVHSQQMRAGTLSDDDRQRLRHAAALIDNAPLWIDDKLSRTLSGIEAGIRKLTATKGIAPRLIIVDYIQLMKGVGRQENRVQELAEISHGMKHLAVRTKATVILLSQLNRGCEQDNRRPQLSDIKECGSIEEDADVVLFTHRPDRMGSDAEFIVAKQRNGPIGMMSMVFHGATQRFEEVGGPMT